VFLACARAAFTLIDPADGHGKRMSVADCNKRRRGLDVPVAISGIAVPDIGGQGERVPSGFVGTVSEQGKGFKRSPSARRFWTNG